MNSWPHKHILTLKNFSKEDFKIVIDLAHRFYSLNRDENEPLPSLKGFLITSLFFAQSTRTKNTQTIRNSNKNLFEESNNIGNRFDMSFRC